MSSQPTRACPKCGLPSQGGQSFCANCGSSIEGESNKPTELTPFSIYDASVPDMETHIAFTPPPPPEVSHNQPVFPSQNYPTPAPDYATPPSGYVTPAPGYATPAPGYQPTFQAPMPGYQMPEEFLSAQRPAGIPLKDSSKGVLGQIGCAMLSLILIGLLVCGGLSYLVYYIISSNSQSTSKPQNMLHNAASVDPLNADQMTVSQVTPVSCKKFSRAILLPDRLSSSQKNFSVFFVSDRLIVLYPG